MGSLMSSAMPNVYKADLGRPRDTLPVCAKSKSTVQALSYCLIRHHPEWNWNRPLDRCLTSANISSDSIRFLKQHNPSVSCA